VGGKRQPVQCLRKTQDKFAIVSMAKKFLHRYIGAHALMHVHFVRRVCMHLDTCLSTMHVQVCMLDRCCDISVHICAHARYRMCICAHVSAVCSFSVWERGCEDSASL